MVPCEASMKDMLPEAVALASGGVVVATGVAGIGLLGALSAFTALTGGLGGIAAGLTAPLASAVAASQLVAASVPIIPIMTTAGVVSMTAAGGSIAS